MKKFEEEPLLNNNINNDNKSKYFVLNKEIIEKEGKKIKREFSEYYDNESNNNTTETICKLIVVIIIFVFFLVFKKKFISLKQNYLSDSSVFPLSIFYSEPKYNFLLFIILTCCFTVSCGFKLFILQLISYIFGLIFIISKNKIIHQKNIFDKNLVVFHCIDIIISFLYLGEILIKIFEENSTNIFIQIIIFFFNYNALLYFVLVEILYCKYDDIIIIINLALLIIVSIYYSLLYILKPKAWPKKIISYLLREIYVTFFISLTILIFAFMLFFYFDQLEYFFVNKILMKVIGFLIYLIFELHFLFKDKGEKKLKYFNAYNIYENAYLYSHTSKIKLFIRVTIMVLLDYFLLYKLDFSYHKNMEIYKCIIIIIFDILHGFLAMFIMKYIFSLIHLNNNEILFFDSSNPFMRFGSLCNVNEDVPPLAFE